MAIVTTTAALTRQYNAFTGLSASERSQSGIARAEVVYFVTNDSWPAASSGTNRSYSSGVVDLPKDFGYVLTDCSIDVRTASVSATLQLEAVGGFELRIGGTLGPIHHIPLVNYASRAEDVHTTGVGSIPNAEYNTNYPSIHGEKGQMTFILRDKPTEIIYPFGSQTYTSTPNPASQFRFAITEQNTSVGEYEVTCYLRFLQYDIDQSYNYVIQSPQLTR
jgi:hypothetical protein